MKKLKQFFLGIILGFFLCFFSAYGSTLLESREVFYDNSKSGGNSNNVQGSIEELYEKSNQCTTGSCSLTESNFFVAYTYNQDKGSSDYCVTGDEVTCKRNDCYTSSKKICPAGTIIDYIVAGNNSKVRFHVIKDQGKKMTMQSQKNTLKNIKWYTTNDTTKGPLTILEKLEKATEGWSNVESQTYTMGTTIFQDNSWTGCSEYNSCSNNIYTWNARTSKVRMITTQEAASLGCTTSNSSCPIWLYNYLYYSTSYGATQDDNTNDPATNSGYWTMSTYLLDKTHAWFIAREGVVFTNNQWGVATSTLFGARAVIEVSK